MNYNFVNLKKKLNIYIISLKWVINIYLAKIINSLINKYFITYNIRPKYFKHINTKSANIIHSKQLAIIIQGPLDINNNFTIETVSLYKEIFKGAHIIVSTWEGETDKSLEQLNKLDVELLLNTKPKIVDPYNMNMQLETTYNGLLCAENEGFKHLLKTRTDQRVHRHDIFDYFTSLSNIFPLNNANKQESRLIVTSFGTLKYRLYSITDFMMFGKAGDMLNYWGVDKYEKGIRKFIDDSTQNGVPIKGGVPIMGEIYLCVKYLNFQGLEPDWTINQYWNFVKEYFCVINGMDLDIYWNKYHKIKEYQQPRYTRDYSKSNPRALEFADWLYLYTHDNGCWENIRELETFEYINGIPSIKEL